MQLCLVEHVEWSARYPKPHHAAKSFEIDLLNRDGTLKPVELVVWHSGKTPPPLAIELLRICGTDVDSYAQIRFNTHCQWLNDLTDSVYCPCTVEERGGLFYMVDDIGGGGPTMSKAMHEAIERMQQSPALEITSVEVIR